MSNKEIEIEPLVRDPHTALHQKILKIGPHRTDRPHQVQQKPKKMHQLILSRPRIPALDHQNKTVSHVTMVLYFFLRNCCRDFCCTDFEFKKIIKLLNKIVNLPKL